MAIDTDDIRSKITAMRSFSYTGILTLCDEIDRLRAEANPTPQQQEGKTVKVRVAVAVDKNAHWSAAGWQGSDDGAMRDAASEMVEEGEAIYWLTATLPVPEEREVVAAVDTATNGETVTSGGRE